MGKNLQPRRLYPGRAPFRTKGEIKNFPDKKALKELGTTKPDLLIIIVKWCSSEISLPILFLFGW